MEMTERTTSRRRAGDECDHVDDEEVHDLHEPIAERCVGGQGGSNGPAGSDRRRSTSRTSRAIIARKSSSSSSHEEEQDDASVPPVDLDDEGDEDMMMVDPQRTLNPIKAKARNGGFVKRRPRSAVADLAGMAGNVLEWYDFAVFGYLSDIIGQVFFPIAAQAVAVSEAVGTSNPIDDALFPPDRFLQLASNVTASTAFVADPTDVNGSISISTSTSNTLYAFAVFGGAFWMRPIGGVLLGYWGDKHGSQSALALSIFLMAIPTFALGCLPTYNQVGYLSTLLLVLVRMVQGLSVGGQLVTSIVFAVEGHPQSSWGYRGSCVMATANVGSLLGSLVGYVLRSSLTYQQLVEWGWRLPFLSGIVVSVAGFYLRSVDEGHGTVPTTYNQVASGTDHSDDHESPPTPDLEPEGHVPDTTSTNPICVSVRPSNLRPLLAATLVPMLWSGAFYLTFVWMAVYMSTLSSSPVPYAFGINSITMFLSLCVFFPLAGIASDRYGRRAVMTLGSGSCAVLGPLAIRSIATGRVVGALAGQLSLGIAVSCFGAPMCAWIVETFPDPNSRLTSANMGYNAAQVLSGGPAPAIATLVVAHWGSSAPGYLYSVLAALSLTGLWIVAPNPVALCESGSTAASCSTTSASNAQDASSPHGHSSFRRRGARGGFTKVPTTELTNSVAATEPHE